MSDYLGKIKISTDEFESFNNVCDAFSHYVINDWLIDKDNYFYFATSRGIFKSTKPF